MNDMVKKLSKSEDQTSDLVDDDKLNVESRENVKPVKQESTQNGVIQEDTNQTAVTSSKTVDNCVVCLGILQYFTSVEFLKEVQLHTIIVYPLLYAWVFHGPLCL